MSRKIAKTPMACWSCDGKWSRHDKCKTCHGWGVLCPKCGAALIKTAPNIWICIWAQANASKCDYSLIEDNGG